MGYYFISIGGSGAKIMESLTHLCVAGLMPNTNQDKKLHVMSIDPDTGNGNLARSSAALHNFEKFQELKIGSNTPLFKTKVNIIRPFPWSPVRRDSNLDYLMSYQSHKKTPLGHLYEALYTKKERETNLNEGFRGHPTIGAAVLAQKTASDQQARNAAPEGWDDFAEKVRQDVQSGGEARIFLAGSVFGGTGAAGMPTIAKLLTRTFEAADRQGKLFIGGAFVLPYFSFPPMGDLDGQMYARSKNFLPNTKAALKYYAALDAAYNSMYFIGEDVAAPVKNFSVGAKSQQNDAHIVDFYGALAALDFFQSPTDKYAYISRANEGLFKWTDFPDIQMEDGSRISLKERFGQFTKFVLAYAHLVKPVLQGLSSGSLREDFYPWFVDYFQGINISDDAVKNFEEYVESFALWLQQLESGADGRKMELIRQDAFGAAPACLDPGRFQKLVYEENSALTMHELWYRLSEHPGKDDETSEGFGRFLRALYDCCKNEEA